MSARARAGIVLLALGVLVAIASTAVAVHDVNVFELEGNAVTNNPTPGIPDDWDRVANGTANTTEGTSFKTDPANQTIFTGGGSKDDLDISKWKWKNGSVPDKDELLHAYAARYTCSLSAGCTGTLGDRYLFFGADRFDNSGDAQIGFWFLQGDVSPQGSGGGGGSPFGPDAHSIGDILVLSDFTQGGTQPTIRVFMWDPTHTPASELVDGTLVPLAGTASTPATCGSSSGDDFCAIVNTPTPPALTDAPWSFTDKSGNPDFARGEFYEGGINLSALPGNVAQECFASFLAETRSSQSVDAVLKDFVLDRFQPCQSGIETTPQNSTIQIGQSNTDNAVVTGQGGGTPTGTVKFFICSPSQLDAAGKCSTGGTQVGSPSDGETLTPHPTDATKALASSDPFTPTTVGTWCFRGEYVPAVGSPYDPASDFETRECFTVTALQPGITTTQTFTVKDSATITVASGGGNIQGTLRFRLFTTSDCTGTTLVDQSFTGINQASPVTKETTPVNITTSKPTLKWLVEFDSTNPNHNDVTSACGTENASLTIVNS